ncbi:MAG: hypothetical protein M3546_13780 [Actinomycetota bacterium]|nr:hypothetical protein [Actinomycetota bacterium]
MVLAEHFTPVGPVVTTTLETVRFEPPERVHFRLVRGPVPYVAERFVLRDIAGSTELEYSGELGTDLWALGRAWAALVAPRWEAAVHRSLAAVKKEAERRDGPRIAAVHSRLGGDENGHADDRAPGGRIAESVRPPRHTPNRPARP